jgi:hypothetical protein
MGNLTLHHGDARAEYVLHPTETARRALMAAAEIEQPDWAAVLRRVAVALPRRAPIKARDDERQVQDRERKAATEERYSKDREAREVWFRTPASARQSLVLHVLGDEQLIIPELMLGINAELGYPRVEGEGPGKPYNVGKAPVAVYNGDVSRLVWRMFRAGQLERVAEPAPGCKIRHRYSRKPEGDDA